MGLLDQAAKIDKKKPTRVVRPLTAVAKPKVSNNLPAKTRQNRTILYETDLDRIYETVQSRGNITVEELSKQYNLPFDQIEGLVKIMNNEKLLELFYPVAGKISVRKTGYNPMVGAEPVNNKKYVNLVVFGIMVFAIIILVFKLSGRI